MKKSITLSKIKNFCLVILFLINSICFAQTQCPNSDFETGTLSGWVGQTGWWGLAPSLCRNGNTAGIPGPLTTGHIDGRQTIMTSGFDPNTNYTINYVAPGGTFSARLGNDDSCFETETISYTIIPTNLNNFFIYKYAIVLEEPGPRFPQHDTNQKPHFTVSVTDNTGNIIDPVCGKYEVYSDSALPGWETWPSNNGTANFKDWTTVGIDLSPYIGLASPITITFQTFDCALGAHYGYAYVDAYCSTLELTDCYSNPSVTLTAPEGFISYLWSTGETTQEIIIANPIQGDTYTCTLTSVTNCVITLSKTLSTFPIVTPDFSYTNCSKTFTFTNTTTFTPPSASSTSTGLTTYLWDFGDGSTSTSENPTHTYDIPGDYTVTFTISNSSGTCSYTKTQTIQVYAIIPTFNAVAPICSNAPLSPLPLISNNGITGTWSPALDNTVTTTYTFTPTASQCATNTDLTIIVHPMPVLQVTSLSPLYYCDPNNDGFGVFDMTQVIPSINGPTPYPINFHETITDAIINGTYIPIPSDYYNISVNNQTVYITVESLTSNSCFIVIPLDLIVNPTPEAEPADYHVCDDNYDGFATFDLTSITPEVLGTINPVTNSINYYTSLADAQTNSNPINNLTNFINTTINTQTLWIRVETIATGCFDIVTLQLAVDPLPNATQPNYPPYTLCDNDQTSLGFETFDLGSKINDILLGQNGMSVNFYFSQADALSDSNALPLLYVNSAIYVQTLWIRIENVFTGCFVLSTMDIRIEPLPSPIPPSGPYTICDGNQDGFSSFDLNTLTSDILQGANYTITYHETFTNAQLGSNSLVSPYDNLNPFIQFIYASALDNVNGCRSVIPIELNVEPKPKMPTNIPPIVQCDEDNNSQDLTMLFDLTQITPIILAVQDMAASNYTVTYYISEADAIAGLAPIIQSTAYTGANNQIIWVRVENNASQCFAIGSFMLSINPPLLSTTPFPLNICDNDAIPNNQFTVFDLTVRNNSITQGQPNMTVTYYPSYPVTASSIAIPNPTSYTNVVPAVQTLGVMVTNAQGCRSYTSLDIRVLPIPTPRTTGINPLPAQCDVNNTGDMLETFNLTLNATIIINGDPTLTLHYYPTQADALAATNEILNPTAALVGQNVWIRVENNRVDYLGNRCFVLVQQPLTINPLPTIIQSLTVQNCDDDADGYAPFDLTSVNAGLLGSTQLPSDFTITYYTTSANAQSGTNAILNPTNFTNTTNPQTIYIRVVNKVTGCLNYGEFTLTVNPKPTATTPAAFETCDVDGTNNGLFTLNLSNYINGIIGTQTNVSVTFYDTQTDADNGTNAITDLVNYQAYTHTVWVRVEDAITGCYQLVPLIITIEPLPEPIISSPTNNICVDYATNVLLSGLTLNSGLTPPNNYTFVWSLDGTVIPGATASTYDITTVAPGDYTVVATSTSSLACVSNVSNTFTVIQSGPAQLSDPAYTVSNPFENNQVIVVNVVGFGQYEFSLDDGPFQNNNVFENVSLGSHTITIRDVEGNISCGEIVIDDIQIINYPHYFTPNGDGINDTWNVVGLEKEPRAKLYIFDRYGKLLKQLSTTGKGWDGTYNGYLLPSTDYWFKIEFPNLKSEWKEFKSHFSLKR